MRCFFAIDVDENTVRELHSVQEQLPLQDAELRKTETFHLTLEFLGEITEVQAEQCIAAASKISFPKFQATLGASGLFPPQHSPRVIYLTVEPAATLLNLQTLLHDSLQGITALENRKFEPHITLARIRSLKNQQAFIDQFNRIPSAHASFPVLRFSFKQSTLTPQGPIHKDLAVFPLED